MYTRRVLFFLLKSFFLTFVSRNRCYVFETGETLFWRRSKKFRLPTDCFSSPFSVILCDWIPTCALFFLRWISHQLRWCLLATKPTSDDIVCVANDQTKRNRSHAHHSGKFDEVTEKNNTSEGISIERKKKESREREKKAIYWKNECIKEFMMMMENNNNQ